MYEEFFSLQMKPFELVPNPQMLFPSRTHRKALSYLEYGFRERAGFILLTGEVGSGKTTLIRNLIKGLEQNVVRAMVFNTLVSPEQLMAMINEEFGLEVAGKGKVALLHDLNDFLTAEFANRRLPLLIIDEAQNLSVEALEEIRLLSNLELDSAKLLQIVLVGQPELKEIIARPELRQLRQRVAICCHLGVLTREEMEAYIFHRLERAGNRDAVSFAEGCFDRIYSHSGGVPRLVNVCCDFILLAAFVESTRQLDLELVEEVLHDLALDQPGGSGPGSVVDLLPEDEVTALLADLTALRELATVSSQLQERLIRHERVIRKVVRVQQDQTRQLEHRLEGIDGKLERLHQVLVTLGQAESGRVVLKMCE